LLCSCNGRPFIPGLEALEGIQGGKNKHGQTPLFYAIREGKKDAVAWLLKNGASTTMIPYHETEYDYETSFALFFAKTKKCPEIIAMLEKHDKEIVYQKPKNPGIRLELIYCPESASI
jgi:ankyrin repeat protein